jgi:archaellum biogenesis ATPase FlaH
MSFGYEWNRNKRGTMTDFERRLTIDDIQHFPIRAIPERNISLETATTFEVRTELSTADGMSVVAWYFPYHNQKGHLVGYKRKCATTQSKEVGHYQAVGMVSSSCQLFGQHLAGTGIRTKENYNINMVEGEFDVMSVYQVQTNKVKGTNWEGKITPNVVGLQCGTANAVESTAHNETFLKSFDNVVLGFDSDFATPAERLKHIKRGKECKDDVAGCLMTDKLLHVEYKGEYKDPSDYLQEGKCDELVHVFRNPLPYSAEKINSVRDTSFEELLVERPKGVMVDCLPKLMKKLQGIRKKELIVVTGASGVGKSTITKAIAHSLCNSDYRIGNILLEENNDESIKHLIAADLQVNPKTFVGDPLSVAEKGDIHKHYQKYTEKNNVFFLNHFGSLSLDELMNKIKQMVFINKVDYIILDHLSMVISGQTGDDRKQLDMLMTELAAFVAANDVGIIAVSHLKRTNEQPPKVKEGEEPEPWWTSCRKEDLRGSAALEQLSWCVVGIEGEQMPDRSRGRVRLVVLKNRTWSTLGETDVLRMNETTGILEDADDLVDCGI